MRGDHDIDGGMDNVDLGESTEWDLLVQRIKAMPDEERDHAQVMRESRAYDNGWRHACDYLESDLRRNKRQFGLRIEDRVWREVRRRRRAAATQTFYYAAIVTAMVGALLYLSRG